ncbi:hypothetical protein ACHAW6_016199 [Cyclotella cf. meneghiniana]
MSNVDICQRSGMRLGQSFKQEMNRHARAYVCMATLISTVISLACSIISSSWRASSDMPLVLQQMYIGIAGDKGTGKSHCAMHIASRLYVSKMYVDVYLGCKKLQSSPKWTLFFILEEIQ